MNRYFHNHSPRLLSLIAAASLLPAVATAANPSAQDTVNSGVTKFPEQVQQQKLIDNTKIIYFGDSDSPRPRRDSVAALITKFYVDQFRHFQDPRSPYFMFMSKDANLAMGIGGTIRMRGWFDWNSSLSANGFSPYLIQIPRTPGDTRRLKATPAGTCLYYSVFGHNDKIGDFMGYIEANFNGYNGVGFRLKKAYFTLSDWTVGYATSTFADPAAEPPTIDGAGPNGDVSKTNVLVRYLHNFNSGLSVAGSLEFPNSQIDATDKNVKANSDYVPDLCALLQYQWNGGVSHVRLSGMLRWLSYRDLVANTNHTIPGWGVQLSATAKVIPNLSLYLLTNVGQGHGSYTGDLSIGNYDLIPDANTPGKLYAPTAVSLTFGAKYNFKPNIYACLALAEQRYLPKHTPNDSQYKYGLYGAVNLFWEITPRIQVGAEYLAGKRMDFDGSHGNANRIDALFQLSF